MKALTFQSIQKISYETVADPILHDDTDVIIKVDLTAICGSDLHVYHGREVGLDHGTVMGHECIGEIVEKGRAVKKFSLGERVFSPFFSSCGQCFYCQSDISCRCEKGNLFGWVEKGQGLQGAQAEYVRIPMADTTLHAITKDIHPEEALLLCDILPTGYFCADMAEVRPNGVYAVVGCGPVGLLAISGLREMGAEKIIAIDLVAERLTAAENFGATGVHNLNGEAVEKVKEWTDGRGADAVLEVVGNPSAQKLAYKLVRTGGIISTVGVHNAEHFAFQPVELYNKNLTYRTGRCPVQRYIPMLIPVLRQQKYDFRSIISHRLPLEQGVSGYYIFDQKLDSCTKVVLNC